MEKLLEKTEPSEGVLNKGIWKHTINVQRPDGSNMKSFPSGHTATVFTGSHILFNEYKDSCPWIGIGAYGIATATGILRMTNNKHWLSDVITGAGIGILSAEVAYMPCVKYLGSRIAVDIW